MLLESLFFIIYLSTPNCSNKHFLRPKSKIHSPSLPCPLLFHFLFSSWSILKEQKHIRPNTCPLLHFGIVSMICTSTCEPFNGSQVGGIWEIYLSPGSSSATTWLHLICLCLMRLFHLLWYVVHVTQPKYKKQRYG